MKSGCESPEKVKTKRSVSLPILQNIVNKPAVTAKSRVAIWRAIALVTLNLLMIAHIIQWKFTGQTISPIEPSESMFTLQSGAVNAGFIFFIAAISATLIFGRFVCGFGFSPIFLSNQPQKSCKAST